MNLPVLIEFNYSFRVNLRRAVRSLLLSVLIGQAFSNLIEAGLLIISVLHIQADIHDVILTSWMIMVLFSLSVLEGAGIYLLVERNS